MYNSLFDVLFGRGFFDSPFKTESRTELTVGNDNAEVSDDKYVFNFSIGEDVDPDCLKVSVKGDLLKVSYEKETDDSSVKYHFTRNVPEDANLDDVKAELDDAGKTLQVTVARKALPEEKKVKEIPINFED